MITLLRYPVKLTKDGDSFLATFPDIPEAITYGTTRQEALEHAINCLDTVLSFKIKGHEAIPQASGKGKYFVSASPLIAAKVMLYLEMQRQGMRKSDLARKLKIDQKQVDRIIEPHHKSTFGQLEMAFTALGKHMVVGVEELR